MKKKEKKVIDGKGVLSLDGFFKKFVSERTKKKNLKFQKKKEE